MSALIGFMLSTAVLFLYSAIQRMWTANIKAQLVPFSELARPAEPKSLYQHWVRPSAMFLGKHFTILRGFGDDKQVGRLLELAGQAPDVTPDEIYGRRVLGVLVGLVWGAAMYKFLPLALVLGPMAGFFLPLFMLKSSADGRQKQISITMPDFIDILSASVAAGLSIDTAFSVVIGYGDGPLYDEMRRLQRELNIGEPREQSFRRLCARNDSKELRNCVETLLEAEAMGIPIAHVLERLSGDIRVKRQTMIKERVEKLHLKYAPVVLISTLTTELLTLAILWMSVSQIMAQLTSITHTSRVQP